MENQEYNMGFEVSDELRNRLKNKGLDDDRMFALEKFHNAKKENLHHGLNIRTDLEFIDYDSSMSEGRTDITYEHNTLFDNKSVHLIKFHEFIHDKNFDKDFKDDILRQISGNHTSKSASGMNKLDYLHLALSNMSLLVVEHGVSDDEFLKIDRVIEGNSYNHLVIIIRNGSKVNILIMNHHPENHSDEHASIITDFLDVIMEKGSSAQIIEERKFSAKDVVYGRKSAILGKDADMNWINIDKDSRLTMIEQHTILEGEDSKSVMNNIVCGENSEYVMHNISEHTGKGTESLMQNRIGLKKSKAIIKGLVKINESAFNSNGYQKSDILLLDDVSRGISIPDLEIHNDKVRCTHGSTITKPDIEKIFYLQSRGLSKEESTEMLIEGFYDKILKDINNNAIMTELRNDVLGR